MMLAINHLDLVLGVDIHIIQPPGPVPPVPIPHPYIGIVFDVADYLPIIGSTISVNSLPRSIAGTAGRTLPPHFPIGGTFIKPPGNEDENFMGSSTVSFDGDAATYMLLPALSCQCIGIPVPFRANPKKKGKVKSLVLPLSIVLPIPTGAPVFIGGPPIISLFALGMKALFACLGKAFKAISKTKMARKAKLLFKKARQRLFRNMKPGFLKCKILRAEPVDAITGEVVVDQEDVSLPGRLPLEWTRHYGSQSRRRGLCGVGWETPADARLEFDRDGGVVFHDGTGVPTLFEGLPSEEPVQEGLDGGVLSLEGETYMVRVKEGLAYHFPRPEAWKAQPPVGEVLASRICDRFGNSREYVRNEEGLSAIRDSTGRSLSVTSWDGLIRGISLPGTGAEPAQVLLTYIYDEAGNLVEVRDALGAPYRFQYENHCLLRHTDRNGLSFYYAYDELTEEGHCVHAWGDGGLYDYQFEYKPLEGLTEVVDSLGNRSVLSYGQQKVILTETDPLGGVTRFEYDEVGRTTAIVDQDGFRTEYVFDDRGNLMELAQPDGSGIQASYNEMNLLTAWTDANGSTWELAWGEQGQLLSQKSPLGHASSYEYDAFGQLVGYINPRKARTELAYDTFGNPTKLVDALGNATALDYDIRGNVVARRDALGNITRYAYDPKGRLTGIQLPGGGQITCGYDAEDNLTRYVDENGAETRLEYFGQGELKRRIQPDGRKVEYHYDTEERLIGVTNQRGERYTLKRDTLGRIIEETDYWGQTKTYSYSRAGRLEESRDPLGQITQFQTDPLGRILKKTLRGRGGKRLVETFDYDPNGNLIACENPAIRIERVFDTEGQLIEERQGPDVVVKSTYDENGNRISRTFERTGEEAVKHEVSFVYDPLDQAISVTLPGCDPIALERNALGQITKETFGPVHRHLHYNAEGQLTAQQVLERERPLFSQEYRYDLAGNLIEKKDSHFGADLFKYDPMGRILEHLDPQGKVNRNLYDPAGDLLQTKVTGDPESLEWKREGQFDGDIYRFNKAGNLIQRSGKNGVLTLEWDPNQRLEASTRNGIHTTYRYDPLGRRISKETKGVVTQFYWDGDAILGDSKNGLTRNWVYYPVGFKPFLMIHVKKTEDRNNVYLYHNDPNGCPIRIVDIAGNTVWAGHLDPKGRVRDLAHTSSIDRVDNPIRLQGQYEDCETDLNYNRFRYYAPDIGQFVSQDPLGLIAGENVYTPGPNCTGWIDPLGMTCINLQKAIDDIHAAEFGKGKGKGFPMAVTKLSDGTVIVSKVGGKPGLKAQAKAREIFGDKVIFAGGGKGGNLSGIAGHHAEQRGIATALNMNKSLDGATQACTHYSCDECTSVIANSGVSNITGTRAEFGKITRPIGEG